MRAVLLIGCLLLVSAAGDVEKRQEEPSDAAKDVATDAGAVVDLTDDNFDDLIANHAVWMVDVYAPWCSHCRQLEPTWRELARELAAHGIKAGKIDGPQNKVLMNRFGISSFPAIFLLKDGSAWEYEGARTVQALKEFAVSGHEKSSSVPFWKAPNSMMGRVLGQWHKVPSLVRQAYRVLRDERGLSDLSIVVLCLAVPVVVGLFAICVLDGVYLRQARNAAHMTHEHDE